jgi:uncharacterized protein YraI
MLLASECSAQGIDCSGLLGQPPDDDCGPTGTPPSAPPGIQPTLPSAPPPKVEVITPEDLNKPVDVVDPKSLFIVQVPPGDMLNVRTSPDANSPVVGVLQNNASGVRVNQTVDLPSGARWAMICHGSVCGWVNASYLSRQAEPGAGGGTAAVILRVVNVASWDALNMRTGPSANSPVVSAIPANASGVAWMGERAQNGNTQWIFVEYGGARGWVNATYLSQ